MGCGTSREQSKGLGLVCTDVCMIITEYVGTGRDAFNLAMTSSTWNEYVRFSPAFYRLIQNKYPFRYRMACEEHRGEDPLDVDWRAHCSRASRDKKHHHITNSKERIDTDPSTWSSLLRTFSVAGGHPLQKYDSLSTKKRIVMIGLDAGGKTTMMYKLRLNLELQVSTIGFQVETAQHKNIKFVSFDVGTSLNIRPLYRHYLEGLDALVIVVDSNDRDRMRSMSGCGTIKYELDMLLQKFKVELASVALLVIANKQDLPNAMTVEEVAAALELDKIVDREWCIQGTCCISGDGLYEAFDWLKPRL